MLEVRVKNVERVARALAKSHRKVRRNFEIAARVEAYRLRRALMRDMARGRAGDTAFAPLTVIGRYWTRGQRGRGNSPRRRPLAALARAITYDYQSGLGRGRFALYVGVTRRTGASWRRIAAFQAGGGEVRVSERMREGLAGRGGRLSRRSINRKYFFLRKSTRTFHVPARPFIGPFWRANEDDAWRNIRKNFRRKMRGERI